MDERARGAETHGTCTQGAAQLSRHGADVVRRGHAVFGGAPFAHGVDPQCAVRHLCTHVHGKGFACHGVEVLRKGFPLPLHALGQGGAGDVFNTFHQTNEPLMAVGFDGRKPHAAVAYYHCGHAMPTGRREVGVPGDLAVVVGVHVHPTWGDERAVGVDFALARAGLAAHLRDERAIDGDVTYAAWRTTAVNEGAISNDDVVHF